MLAKIVDENKKIVDVALGSDIDFYKSMGMIEMDVEQAYNGVYYVKGYAPSKPEPTIDELKQYLSDTDYVVIKIAEGVATKEEYSEILDKREKVREQIRKLEK